MSDSRYMNTLDKIQSHLELLSKSERKVAEVIRPPHRPPFTPALPRWRAWPTSANLPSTAFAAALIPKAFPISNCTSPKAANGTPYVNRNVEEDDSVDSYTSKIFESVMASTDTVKANLDIAAINRAVDLLTRAKRSLSSAQAPPRRWRTTR